MKIILPLAFGLILSLSALSSNTLKMSKPSSVLSKDEINQQMNELFLKRDSFVEKGNYLPHLQVHH
jgi:hypothetical protein